MLAFPNAVVSALETAMKPVWIKYYGIIPMTKRGYLIALAAAGGFALLAVLAAAAFGFLPPLRA